MVYICKTKRWRKSRAKPCYIDTDSFIICTKADNFYQCSNNDIGKSFDTSNYEADQQLAIGKNKKKRFRYDKKNKLDEIIMKEFLGLRSQLC